MTVKGHCPAIIESIGVGADDFNKQIIHSRSMYVNEFSARYTSEVRSCFRAQTCEITRPRWSFEYTDCEDTSAFTQSADAVTLRKEDNQATA